MSAKQKPTLEQFFRRQIKQIRKAFLVPMRVTIICRHATEAEAEIVFTDDNMDALIATLQRRRDAVVASQRAEAAS